MEADSPVVTYIYEAASYGGPQEPNIGVKHDVECPLEDGYARSLTGPAWFGSPKAGTSTHYLVGPDDICQGVPENRIAWHCGTGNRGTIAVEECGYARFSYTDWSTPKGLKQRTNVAQLMADINKRKPLIRLKWLSDSELRTAWNNPGSPGGWATHDQMRRVIGGTTHYDPMNAPNATTAYPLTEVMHEAIAIRNGSNPEQDWFDMATEEDLRRIVREEVGNRLKDLDGIIRETYNRADWTNTNLDKFMGDGSTPSSVGYKVWSQIINEFEGGKPAWVPLVRAAEGDDAVKS